jgi:ubiquinone/menaquinone biosynthesis C-methylase UbiE
LFEAAEHLLQVDRADRLLVLGCQDGAACRRLARLASEGIVIGMDSSDDLIREARAMSAAVENIIYIWTPAEQLPWQENFFTKVLAMRADRPPYFSDAPLREIGRVLAEGGTVWLLGASEDDDAKLAQLGFEHVQHNEIPASADLPPIHLVSARKPVPPGLEGL